MPDVAHSSHGTLGAVTESESPRVSNICGLRSLKVILGAAHRHAWQAGTVPAPVSRAGVCY